MFFLIQITDYKNINGIFFICPKAALNIQNEYNDISAHLYSARPLMLADEKNTCTLNARTLNQSYSGTSRDGTRRRSRKQKSSVLQCVCLFFSSLGFVVFLVSVTYRQQKTHSPQ